MRCPDRLPEATCRQVLDQLAELSPVVQAAPSAALAELKGALRQEAVVSDDTYPAAYTSGSEVRM
ncbi:hypothetical protein ACF1G5_33565 [Streptomyces coeruleorubidus]|uniref:hypothetical protein n=1 Tax=Streptomyces coeruleorubidus TaxID=116188 RepID=UPI00370186FD